MRNGRQPAFPYGYPKGALGYGGCCHLPEEAAYKARAPGDIGLRAGFSGWYPMGSVDRIVQGIPPRGEGSIRRARAASLRLLERLREKSGVNIPANSPLLYRLIRHNPRAAKKYRTLYIGSSKDGNVVRRLITHVHGLPGGSSALHRWLVPPQPHLRKDLGRIYFHIGFATNQPRPRSRYQQDINYNELFLIEKLLQREYRPLVWDPNDRSFDEGDIDDGIYL